jgi:cytochrome b561
MAELVSAIHVWGYRIKRGTAPRQESREMEDRQRHGYGGTAVWLHWLVVALLVIQYSIGFLMPDIHRNEQPGAMMNLHISSGLLILALVLLRLFWRITHRVAPEHSLPAWQRIASEGVHWLLYLLVLVTTLTGWTFASMRGWPISFFGLFPLPPLVAEGSPTGHDIGELHQDIIWVLLAVIALHVVAALYHEFVRRDGVMDRMLPATMRRAR